MIKLVIRVSFGRSKAKNIPLGFMICPEENTANYKVFNSMCKKASQLWCFMSQVGFVVFSDRDKGLLRAIGEDLPNSHHQNCGQHMMRNSMQKKHGGKYPEALFWG